MHLSRSFIPALLFGLSLVLILMPSSARSDNVSIRQPTDPCTVKKCPSVSNEEIRPAVEPRQISSTIDEVKIMNLKNTAFASEEDISLEDGLRMRACSNAVKKYRPEPAVELETEYEDEYLANCLQSPDKLPELQAAILKTAIARLYVSEININCTILILNSGAALTARHCFLDTENIDADISTSSLTSASIQGVDQAGNTWSINGLKVRSDPFLKGSPLNERLSLIDLDPSLKRSRDFIVVEPQHEADRFPNIIQIKLLPKNEVVRVLAQKQRFILPSTGDHKLLVDNMPSCISTSYTDNAWFFQHHCQSIEGSSGAPLLIYSDQMPLLVAGIHIGRVGTFAHVTNESIGENEAVLIPKELVDEFE